MGRSYDNVPYLKIRAVHLRIGSSYEFREEGNESVGSVETGNFLTK